jgi:hypothetical protein
LDPIKSCYSSHVRWDTRAVISAFTSTADTGTGADTFSVVEETTLEWVSESVSDSRCTSGDTSGIGGEWESVEIEWVGGVWSSHTTTERVGWGTGVVGSVDGIGVVKPLGTTEVSGGVDVDIGVRLYDPYEFFAWVIEVEFDFVAL